MDPADLAAHTSTWDEPISTDYRGDRIWECPPNGQGIVALLALNILEDFDLPGCDPLGAQRLHLIAEALRLAFADARAFIGDPRQVPVPVEALLSKDYAGAAPRADRSCTCAAGHPARYATWPLRHGVPVRRRLERQRVLVHQ